MGAVSEGRIAELVAPYVGGFAVPEGLFGKLAVYLELLVKWNARTNLTAIREPEEMVRRHFGESLFVGAQMAGRMTAGAAVMDFGSGAGFPGLPVQLLLPELRVTLAESQGKKASFLREAVRVLGLGTEVWGERVESMAGERRFDVVMMRAVDNMGLAMEVARGRVVDGGWLVSLAGGGTEGRENIVMPGGGHGWLTMERVGS